MKKILSIVLVLALCLALLPLSASATTNITRVNLTLEYPVAGKTAYTTAAINGNGYSVYSIEWYDRTDSRFLDTGEKFQADHQYKATVWVEAKEGYQFSHADDNTPAIGGYINGEEVEVTKAFEYKAWAMVCLTYYFPSTPAKGWIKSVSLIVPAPVVGEEPSYTQLTGNGYGSANVSFSGSGNPNMQNGIAWYVGSELLKPGHDSFDENTIYTFHCLLFPEGENYRFTPDAKVTVNGKEAEVSLDYDTFLSVTYEFPATGAKHTHTPSEWRTTGAYHYKACTECGDMLDQEDHKGGVATCEKDGVCSVCGYAYIEAKEHKWSPTYLYQDATGHAWICADCKATSAIEKHNPGPAATNTTPQTCKDCGYIIAPAKNHTHELTKIPQTPATCLEEGNIEYYACSGCNNRFTDAEAKNQIPDTMSVAVGALGHTPSDVWGVDDDYHWRVCTTCNQVLDETKMQHDVTDGKCTTCNYVIGDRVTNPETTPAETTPEPGHNAEQDNNAWIKILLVALVCFAAAITATVIILKRKKGE